MLDQRGRLLVAALGFAGCSHDRALWALRSCLPYEPGPTRRWLKVKVPDWTLAEDRWQRRITAGA